jgi:hypothetical protein
MSLKIDVSRVRTEDELVERMLKAIREYRK